MLKMTQVLARKRRTRMMMIERNIMTHRRVKATI